MTKTKLLTQKALAIPIAIALAIALAIPAAIEAATVIDAIAIVIRIGLKFIVLMEEALLGPESTRIHMERKDGM